MVGVEDHVLWRPPPGAEVRRYGLAAALVLALMAGGLARLRGPAYDTAADQTDGAVLVDLPPALASAQIEEPAAPAAAAQPASEVAPKPPETPPAPTEAPAPAPMPAKAPVAPPEPVQPPPPAVAAASVAPASVTTAHEAIDEEESRRRAARVMSVWQRAMLVRLERAKQGVAPQSRAGTVLVGFTIDHVGRLVSSRIVRSAGRVRLDRAALSLLARAAPFPPPPAGAPESALSFTVPIVFAAENEDRSRDRP